MEEKTNRTDLDELIKQYVGEDGGIPEASIGTLTKAIRNVVGTEYVEKERYRAKLDEIDNLKEQQQSAEDSATVAEKWEKRYKAVKKEFDDYKSEQTAKEIKATKQAAYRVLLKEAGISDRRLDSVLKVSDVDGLEIDDDGNVEGKDKLIEGIKKEWSDFIETTKTTGAETPTPPTNNSPVLKSKAEIYAKDESGRFIMSAEERQKAWDEYLAAQR